jgi:hypothetical protein
MDFALYNKINSLIKMDDIHNRHDLHIIHKFVTIIESMDKDNIRFFTSNIWRVSECLIRKNSDDLKFVSENIKILVNNIFQLADLILNFNEYSTNHN